MYLSFFKMNQGHVQYIYFTIDILLVMSLVNLLIVYLRQALFDFEQDIINAVIWLTISLTV